MHIVSGSVRDTLRFGRRIARHARPGDIVCLFGDLGSGKTVLAKGIAQGLGIDRACVTSPTFVLMHRYDGRMPMYHFDLYRIQDAGQIEDLGYEEYMFDNGVAVIEWAGRMGTLIPDAYLKVEMRPAGRNRRRIRVTAVGAAYKEVLKRIDEDTRA